MEAILKDGEGGRGGISRWGSEILIDMGGRNHVFKRWESDMSTANLLSLIYGIVIALVESYVSR